MRKYRKVQDHLVSNGWLKGKWEEEAHMRSDQRFQDLWLLTGSVLPLLPKLNTLLKARRCNLQIMRVALPGSVGSVIGVHLPEKYHKQILADLRALQPLKPWELNKRKADRVLAGVVGGTVEAVAGAAAAAGLAGGEDDAALAKLLDPYGAGAFSSDEEGEEAGGFAAGGYDGGAAAGGSALRSERKPSARRSGGGRRAGLVRMAKAGAGEEEGGGGYGGGDLEEERKRRLKSAGGLPSWLPGVLLLAWSTGWLAAWECCWWAGRCALLCSI
jgi:hypothetical protein